jgi:hypothetical protein
MLQYSTITSRNAIAVTGARGGGERRLAGAHRSCGTFYLTPWIPPFRTLIIGTVFGTFLIHARVPVQVHRLRAAAYGRLGSRNLEKLFDLFDEDGNRELVMSIILGSHPRPAF